MKTGQGQLSVTSGLLTAVSNMACDVWFSYLADHQSAVAANHEVLRGVCHI